MAKTSLLGKSINHYTVYFLVSDLHIWLLNVVASSGKDRKDRGLTRLLSLLCGKWIRNAEPKWELKPGLHLAGLPGFSFSYWQILGGFY